MLSLTLKAIQNAGLFAIFLATRPALAQPLDGCPSGREAAREVLVAYLSDPEWADERQEAGISISPGQIHLLTDKQDPDVCQTLANGTNNSE